jgi:hypothetical protein
LIEKEFDCFLATIVVALLLVIEVVLGSNQRVRIFNTAQNTLPISCCFSKIRAFDETKYQSVKSLIINRPVTGR